MVDKEESQSVNYRNLEDCFQDLIKNYDWDKSLRLNKITKENDDNQSYESTFLTVEYEQESEEMDVNKLNHNASDFTAVDCGEPMFSQHLRMDFTPVAGVDDNDQLQSKCIDFWNFLYSQPQLEKFLVSPMKEKKCGVMEAESFKSDSLEESENIHAINWVNTTVGQPDVFLTKHPIKYCDIDGQDYAENSAGQSRGRKKHKENYVKRNIASAVRNILAKETKEESRQGSSLPAMALCTQLNDWDNKHPQCMDPPGPVPTLIHAFLQRKSQER